MERGVSASILLVDVSAVFYENGCCAKRVVLTGSVERSVSFSILLVDVGSVADE